MEMSFFVDTLDFNYKIQDDSFARRRISKSRGTAHIPRLWAQTPGNKRLYYVMNKLFLCKGIKAFSFHSSRWARKLLVRLGDRTQE